MTNPNDSAFPQMRKYIDLRDKEAVIVYSDTPLTKREYFAAMALQGLLACSSKELDVWQNKDFAKSSVDMADELIKILNKTNHEPQL